MNLNLTAPELYLPGLHVGLQHYLILAALLFAMGLFAVVTRRHAVAILLGLELMLNAVNLNLVAFNRYLGPERLSGQVFALMVIALAACEAAVGLALILALYRNLGSVTPDEVDELKW
jgi:NAD(P)H-quinone oxidoreductase subunit 4L